MAEPNQIKNTGLARENAEKWFRLVRVYPELQGIQALGEWTQWQSTHPTVPFSEWSNKEIADLISEQTQEFALPKESGQKPYGSLGESLLRLASTPFLLLAFKKPEFMEEDARYQNIQKQVKEEWFKNNPDKNTLSKEWLDYRYGSLENDQLPTLSSDAEALFRQKQPKRAAKYDKKALKTYKKLEDDPMVQQTLERIQAHSARRYRYLEKEDSDQNWKNVRRQIVEQEWKRFAERFPEKAKAYASKNQVIQRAYERYLIRQAGVKYPEKIHPERSETTLEAAAQRLESIPTPTQTKYDLSFPEKKEEQSQPSLTVVRRLGQLRQPPPSPPVPPSPPPTPIQSGPEPFSLPGRGGVIDRINALPKSFPRIGGGLGRLGASGAGAAARAAPLLANPYVLIGGAIIALFIIVFVIVFGNGGPIIPDQQTGTPPLSAVGYISSCQFTRDGKAVALKSSRVTQMFTEVSQISGVPAAVLASVARHENPGFFQTITDDHPAVMQNFNNTHNASGDLGFMQINIAHSLNIDANTFAARRAAQKLGKAFNGLGYCRPSAEVVDNVNLDFCNIRDSIAIASEVLNIKLANGSWQNLADLERASCWYHNMNCKYPDKNIGPFNYGHEVRRDYENCQQNQLAGPPQTGEGTSLPLLSGILEAAGQIVQKLTKAGRFYAAKLDEGLTGQGSNLYWCTYLIVDSYNKVRATGLDRLRHGAVVNMKSYFQNAQANGGRLRFLGPTSLVSQLRPGDTIFFEGQGQHVSLIKSIVLDPNGNGTIVTYDSNNVVLEDEVSVRNYRALNARTTAHIYSITGFGQLINE